MAKDERPSRDEVRQASTIIAVVSVIGLTACFIVSVSKAVELPFYLYAIFGGGILGTDNVLKIIKTIFRIK